MCCSRCSCECIQRGEDSRQRESEVRPVFLPTESRPKGLMFRSVELFKALKAMKADPTVGQHILDVRGQGLMVAVEFASPSHSAFDPAVRKDSRANLASNISKRCIEKGMLLLTTSVYETVRFIPPLNISSEDLARGIEIFKEAVEEVVQGQI
jgi:4-aminobutyrate aminotransferase